MGILYDPWPPGHAAHLSYCTDYSDANCRPWVGALLMVSAVKEMAGALALLPYIGSDVSISTWTQYKLFGEFLHFHITFCRFVVSCIHGTCQLEL